jgi:uncharacterized membrane protein
LRYNVPNAVAGTFLHERRAAIYHYQFTGRRKMIKWKLMLTTLPFVLGVVVLAYVRDHILHLQGLIEFSEVSPILSVVSLIIGFMLAGVLADYKESEKIPGEIAATLETIGDTVAVVVALNKEADVHDFEPRFHSLVSAVDDWLNRRVGVDYCYAALSDFRDVVQRMHPAVGVNYTIRTLGETNNLRRSITRADVIERTSFIPVGYALLDLLVGSTILLLLAANYKTSVSEYFLISLFSLIYIYMDRLIRDVDQPFLYRVNKNITSSAEVNPYPLQEYRQRLEGNPE